MRDEDSEATGSSTAAAYRGLLVAVLGLVALVVIVGAVVSRADDESPQPSSSAPFRSETTTTSTVPSTRAQVISRLHKILRTRDEALSTRNASLFNQIYTVDCRCLVDGRALVRQLRKDKVVWRGVETEIVVKSAEEVSERLWIIVATVRTLPVRIETESGHLIRVVSPEQNVVRFALARPKNDDEWLLGHASNLD
jgi:hypothetical protein